MMEDKIIFKYCILGIIAGYFIFHPLVMLLSHFMAFHSPSSVITFVNHLTSVILKSFSFDMLPWSLSFALFNAVIGIYYAKIKQTKLAREALISDLQNALDEVKKLSGMLPICSSCKKIRDDGGYWQQIEEYIRDHSEADFTHGIYVMNVWKSSILNFIKHLKKKRIMKSYPTEIFTSISNHFDKLLLTILMSR